MLSVRILSVLIALSFVLSTPMMPLIAYAEEAPAESGATGGDGGSGGTGGGGVDAGAGGDAGTGGDASGSSDPGDSTSTAGDGGTGGTGGDSTGGGTTGTGGDGGTGGTGGDATNTADGGTSDATGGDGGTGGGGGTAESGGTAGDGGTGATGGDAAADSTTDDGSDAAADAAAGDGGAGGGGGDGTGAEADGGTGGDGAVAGAADSSADAQSGGDAAADATGGDGGGGGGGGSGGGGSDPIPDGNPSTIETGNASSSATVGNQANTSDVDVPLGNEAEDDETEVDFQNVLGATTTATSTAETGDNEIIDPDGGTIVSGMADAFLFILQLFNVATVNSTGAIHFFKNPIGDALDFTQKFIDAFAEWAQNGACSLDGCDGVEGVVLEVHDESVMEVETTGITRADTSGNTVIAEDGVADITTGDADAMTTIATIGDIAMVDSRYLLLFMANQGDLDGDILLPDGDFFKRLSTGAHVGVASDIEIDNNATSTNTASSTAGTGENGANGAQGSDVTSGNANSTASTVNFINMLGAPICFIASVGGAWTGEVVQLPENFSHAHAEFGEVICGVGGESRDPVTGLELEVENHAQLFITAIAEATTGDNYAEGLLAKVKTGDASAFAQILNLVNITLIGQDWIFANFAVSGDWNGDLVFGVKPGEPDILGELIEQHVTGGGSSSGGSGGGGGGGGGGGNVASPNITFKKEASVEQAQSPAKIDYTLTVDNQGGKASKVFVEDTMKGPDGKVIGKQMWNLGTVKANEEVKITYTIEFKGDVTPGYYTNTAILTGNKADSLPFMTLTASDVVEVLAPGEVAAAKTCTPVLTEYIRPWRINSAGQVKALQSFLNAYEGENLSETGSYDMLTQAAVKRFQSKYAADILSPWGITSPTGNVYYTTQKKVNQVACGDLDFSLSAAQQAEINAFKNVAKKVQADTIKKGSTGSMPKNYLMMPAPVLPIFFKDASEGTGASTSASLKQQFKSFSSWLVFAPLVDALEI